LFFNLRCHCPHAPPPCSANSLTAFCYHTLTPLSSANHYTSTLLTPHRSPHPTAHRQFSAVSVPSRMDLRPLAHCSGLLLPLQLYQT
ncbi:hypothetical protein AVEN_193945-1, partial [Araneus ventricosus]